MRKNERKGFGNMHYKKGRRKPATWYLPDLNWGHTDFQSVALPTELRHPAKKVMQK